MARARIGLICTVLIVTAAAASDAFGQAECTVRASTGGGDPHRWEAPLDRPVTLAAGRVSVRESLERLSAAAGIRISYSSESLDLERVVCASFTRVPLGWAIDVLVGEGGAQPTVVGADHVVLTQARAAAPAPDLREALPVVELERVLVTGTPEAVPLRQASGSEVIVGSEALERSGVATLDRLLALSVPGMWAWNRSASDLLTRYGGVRGASSFGSSYPKVYLDGVELANPLVVNELAPEAVERVEVIRGPKGSALYGNGALSGVIRIVTRQGAAETGEALGYLRSSVGVSASDYATGSTIGQEHRFGLRGGTARRSAGVDVTVGTVGAYLPGAFSRSIGVSASGRQVREGMVVTGTARLFAQRASAPSSPVLVELLGLSLGPHARPGVSGVVQSLRHHTFGLSGTVGSGEAWTHGWLLGLDGYQLVGGAGNEFGDPVVAPVAPATQRTGANRGTLRVSTTGRLRVADEVRATVALSAEESLLREETVGVLDLDDELRTAAEPLLTTRRGTGLVAQGRLLLHEGVELDGGVRLERSLGLTGSEWTALPTIGAAYTTGSDGVMLQLRGGFGRGIRAADAALRELLLANPGARFVARDLPAESQSGVEGGVDLTVGSALALQVTRYDQRASGLIQAIPQAVRPIPPAHKAHTESSSGSRRRGEVVPVRELYRLDTVGSIRNRGWEMQASASTGHWSLAGTMALVDSRVASVARDYTGDLRPGDRVLGIPARTMSVGLSWEDRGWLGSISAHRASDWIYYDRLALYDEAGASQAGASPAAGPDLRDYWRAYGGVTHLQARLSVPIRAGFDLLLNGENLLDRQLGEPDNLTILPGRTVTVGLSASF